MAARAPHTALSTVRTACGSGRLILNRGASKFIDQPPATAGGSDEHPAFPPIPLRRISIIRRLLLVPSFPLCSLENRATAQPSRPPESAPRRSIQLRLDRPAETTLRRPPCNHAKGARSQCWACRQNNLRNQNPYQRRRYSPSGRELSRQSAGRFLRQVECAARGDCSIAARPACCETA